MILLPVIDLMKGIVVHARRGDRNTYVPVKSQMVDSSHPQDIAEAFSSRGFHDCYVADLDAIRGQPPNHDSWQAIFAAGLSLWLDCGIQTAAQLSSLKALRQSLEIDARCIVALESLPTPHDLESVVGIIEPTDVFSLDLRGGLPLGTSRWPREPNKIAELAVHAGFRNLLVLDLAQVGTGQGSGTLDLIAEFKAKWPELSLLGGGGVRNLRDVENLTRAGCDRVLVASALHDGTLVRTDMDESER